MMQIVVRTERIEDCAYLAYRFLLSKNAHNSAPGWKYWFDEDNLRVVHAKIDRISCCLVFLAKREAV